LWTYTTYILSKYFEIHPEKEDELAFSDFADFVFDVLWRKDNLIFHDGVQDLYLDFKYLKKLEIIEFKENDNLEKVKVKIRDKNKISQIVEVVEESATLTGVKLFSEYLQRINKAVERTRVVT